MKRAALAVVLAAAALAAQAQGPAPTGPQPVSSQPPAGTAAPVTPVELTNAADGRKLTVKRNAEIKLVLDLDPLHELGWELDQPLPPALAQIGERIYIGRGTNAYDITAGGFNVYRFRADQPGTVALQLTKHRRTDGQSLATVHYDVTVE